MPATLAIRNESSTKRLYRKDALERLTNRICEGERIHGDVEISLLFCDDETIAELNRQYRDKNAPTDVLAFEQVQKAPGPQRLLGDVVISLETAKRNCGGDRTLLRTEIDLLLCHGLLHLLGYDHSTKRQQEQMKQKQAVYLDCSQCAAWHFGPKTDPVKGTSTTARRGGIRSVG